ncbi:hypothetical protein NUW54_g4085 [Trametes sanguinea]|uniref:Uncharacterized protein n=1 Tax=Trametes sanguinea TaxID=158606 RepID=A0ACC1Q0L4_9APHY|nr:hypothetical protein NUW54_g4085 [Trametes sanguinea]
MSTTRTSKKTTVEQAPFVIPDLSIKELLSAIPYVIRSVSFPACVLNASPSFQNSAHCFERSALRSSLYILLDVVVIASACQLAYLLEGLLTSGGPFNLPDVLYPFARFSVWALYSFIAGLFGFGLWIIGHECGHSAFSESKMVNDVVGFIIHSALGVPFFSWRFSHARHHAGTGHVSRDEVFVPRTRSELGLPPLDPAKEDLGGASVSEEVMKELWEAIGDSPISAAYYSFVYLVWGWPAYLLTNVGGQKRYPQDTHHFNPSATIFRPDQRTQVVISNIGILMWMGAILASISHWGFFNVLKTYLVPYLWVNHWLILVTFLQHTDPMLPHYRASEYTFPRGALSTLDRSLLGDLGSVPRLSIVHVDNARPGKASSDGRSAGFWCAFDPQPLPFPLILRTVVVTDAAPISIPVLFLLWIFHSTCLRPGRTSLHPHPYLCLSLSLDIMRSPSTSVGIRI